MADTIEEKHPIFIQQKNEDAYGLKTGPEFNDCVAFKLFNRDETVDEITRLGFMCDFFEAKGVIESYPEEEFALVFDASEACGERWFICTTPESKQFYMTQGAQEAAAKEEAEKKAAAEEAARLAAEEAERNIEYRDEPVVARAWETGTQDGTVAEIASLNLSSRRPLMSMRVSCPRALVNRHILCQERVSEGAIEYRTHKVPPEDFVEKRQGEKGVQAGGALSVASTQTTWTRLVNKSTMATSVNQENAEVKSSRASPDVSSSSLLRFLDQVSPLIEEVLQQNEAVDIFTDAFVGLGEDDSGLGAKGENDMKELRTFTDLEYSKNNALSAIDWVPGSSSSLGVSVVKNLDFDERVSVSGQVDRAFILLWDFGDLIHPQLKLQAPKEVFCFRFNPTEPMMVVGGLLSGQVALWDLKESMTLLGARRKRRNRKGSKSSRDKGGAEEELLPPVDVCALSTIDASHKRTVADLVWLPWDIQVDSRGALLPQERLVQDKSFQFVTVASDGQLLVWDTRFEEIMHGNMPWLAKPRAKTSGAANDAESEDRKGKVPWLPLYRSHLKRLEGVGELSLCRVCLAAASHRPSSFQRESDGARKTQFFCATEEGDLVFGDWQTGGDPKVNAGDDENDDIVESNECVLWTAKDHSRPCVALQRSPFFPEIFLSVGDWSFQLWKLGLSQPLFSSPVCDAYLTAGRWSPSRPAVLFISRVDGTIDVWDFTDTSYRHSQRLNASPSRVTSMEFLSTTPPGQKDSTSRQLLAVGDSGGNLHVFHIPRPLSRPVPSEIAIMGSFLEKEGASLDAVASGASFNGDAAAEAGAGDSNKHETIADGSRVAGSDAKPSDTNMQFAEDINTEEVTRVQAAYEELEKRFLDRLQEETQA